MRKVSNILFLVGGILAICTAFAFLCSAVVFYIFASPMTTDLIIKGLEEGNIHSTLPGTPEEVAAAIQIAFLIVAIMMTVFIVFAIVSVVVSFLARKENASRALFILNIIFGLLGGSEVNVVGGVLALIDSNRKRIV